MSSTTLSKILFLSEKLNIYLGVPILVLGVFGGLLTIIVFLSLKTFRESSSAFYLTIMSFTNISQLMTGLLTRIVWYQTGINWSLLSGFYCKFRWYLIDVCALISFTCICLATIDQFLATSSNVQWQRYSSIKLSRYLCFMFTLFWILFYIPILVYYQHITSPITAQMSCTLMNSAYQQFITYGHILILTGILPIFLTILFGLLAYRNVRQIPHRFVPLVRRELDKQLTVMVLIQVIFNFSNVAPSTIINVYSSTASTSNDPLINAIMQLLSTIAVCLYYSYFACPFYIYICASKRFRQQLIYVLFQKNYFRRQHQIQPFVINSTSV